MGVDNEYFNCSEKHKVDYMARKFHGVKQEIVNRIKELCKLKKIHYSTHKEVEELLINSGFTKKQEKKMP